MPDDAEPRLTVQFVLDEAGNPTLVQGADHRRYKLLLAVDHAPADAYAATFELDPATTYDPVHTLTPEPDGGFRLETSTHGDYPVVVRLRRSHGEDLVLKDGIVRGLRRAHAPVRNLPPVNEALSYIAEH